ncbi:MAG: hypothetical protein HBSAPP04_12090 [Ignavibacteriaceae bacterium]|nr:MAG: hypothetical protein HBSAPP04_12090 [Ignavibacteriaceae bacterium]
MRIIIPVVLLLFFLSGCGGGDTSTVTFRVTVPPALTENGVFITGNDPVLGDWDPGRIKLERIDDTTWARSFSLPKGKELEFKITGGNWLREAADSGGRISANLKYEVAGDTTLSFSVPAWFNSYRSDTLVITEKRVAKGAPELDLFGGWRYAPGDDIRWSDPKTDDSMLKTVSPRLHSDSSATREWQGTGWFRMPFILDSALWGKEITLMVWDLGEITIWYNGKNIFSETGSGDERKPFVFNMRFDTGREHLLSVRYENGDIHKFIDSRFNTGFAISIMNTDSAFLAVAESTRFMTFNKTLFSVVPVVLIMLHMFLFIFYPEQKHNLYYALCLTGFAGVVWFNYGRATATGTGDLLLAHILGNIAVPFATMFGQLTAWSLVKRTIPKRLWFYVAGFVLMIILNILTTSWWLASLNYVYFITAMSDLVISVLRTDKKEARHGGWLALAGFGLLIFFVVYQILLDYAVIVTPFFGTTQVYVYGLLGLVISMSLYLSYNFAFLNKDLKKQLQTVKELSDKTLEQERIAASLEMERRLVEAENERRKAELEAARDLQLSLLPAKLPDIPGLGLASHIETATEVGGDYYDFFRGEDGSLMIAVGDATGHGLKAGNMVIATKALLNSLSGSTVLPEILMSANGSIKKMNLKMLTMCLALVRIRGDVLEYASAGMPHLLIRRGDTGIVEQHLLKAMPLGAFTGFPYAGSEIPFRKGDTLVVMSDGLTELFNSNGETAGIDRVAEWLASAPASSAGDVLASIRSNAGTWRGDEPLRDDLTILVVQKKD